MAQTARAKRKRETTNPIERAVARRSLLAPPSRPPVSPFFCSWPRATEPGIRSAGAAAGYRRTILRASCQISIGISKGRGREEGKRKEKAKKRGRRWRRSNNGRKREKGRSLALSLTLLALSRSLEGKSKAEAHRPSGRKGHRERKAIKEEETYLACFFFEKGKRKEKRGGEVKKAKKGGRAPLGRCSLSRRQQKERKKELPSLFLFHRSLSLSTSSVLPSL